MMPWNEKYISSLNIYLHHLFYFIPCMVDIFLSGDIIYFIIPSIKYKKEYDANVLLYQILDILSIKCKI